MSQKKIVVPLDGSQLSEHALPVALEIARRREHDLELLAVYEEEPTAGGWALSPARVADSLHEYLDRVTADHTGATILAPSVKAGAVADTIVHEAGRWNVDLVVMATHGRGAVSRAWIGSVADDVVRHATVPVVLVRPLPDEQPSTPRFENVLVALDGSRRAERCLDWATRIGGTDAVYTLLRVVPGKLHAPSTYLPDAIREEAESLASGHDDAAKYLANVAQRMLAEGFTAKTEVIEGVPPAAGVLAYSERHPVDLVAITTHGRSGISRLLLGSVADKVVRGAGVPVLVARAG